MSKVGIIYWSSTGNTEAMAQAVEEGAKAAGADVEIMEVADADVDKALSYDVLALGCPAMGDEELMRVLKDYHEYVGRVRKVTLGETKRAKNSTHEHKQICEAIKNHDALLAEKCAREHINNSKKNMEHLGWENLIK